MAEVIELKAGERPPVRERHALIIARAKPPANGVAFTDHPMGRRYFASPTDRDIAIVIKRAQVWAEAKRIPHIYLRRE